MDADFTDLELMTAYQMDFLAGLYSSDDSTRYTINLSVIQPPPGAARCYPKKKRLIKKLSKRVFLRRYADWRATKRFTLKNAYPTAISRTEISTSYHAEVERDEQKTAQED